MSLSLEVSLREFNVRDRKVYLKIRLLYFDAVALTYKLLYRYCAYRIMDICRMDHSCHRKSKCIYNDMFFFSLIFLLPSTPHSLPFTWREVRTFRESMIPRLGDLLPQGFRTGSLSRYIRFSKTPSCFHFLKIEVDCLPRSKIYGEHSPLAPRFCYVQQGIHDPSERIFSTFFARFEQIFHTLPLFIGQVGWVFSHHFDDVNHKVTKNFLIGRPINSIFFLLPFTSQ